MQKSTAVGIGASVVVIAIIAGVLFLMNRPAEAPTSSSQSTNSSTSSDTTKIQTNDTSNQSAKQGDVTTLEKTDEVVGTGAEAVAGKTVTVNYTGTLTNGTKFDSSFDRNQPFSFQLGAGQVIKGWDEGVAGMKVGGKRKLVIPPDMGYGSAGAGDKIPPNSTLVFEVELLDVK